MWAGGFERTKKQDNKFKCEMQAAHYFLVLIKVTSVNSAFTPLFFIPCPEKGYPSSSYPKEALEHGC